MPKNNKNKKIVTSEIKGKKEDIKKIDGEEETEKESGTLSDGVLDAFDEVAPVVDPLLIDDEVILPEEEEEEEIDSGDYKPLDEW
jgi:hypothetical protein